MPIFISQGRYSRDAMQAMVRNPEDRTKPVSKLIEAPGGGLLGYYVTFGDYDWLLIVEAPDVRSAAAAAITAAAGGGVTDMKTTLAMTEAEAMEAFRSAGSLAASYRLAGQSV
ncbi:GYD domain-containing protein [Microvirga massiliensis]|uniref:GYD domain-containing protein n=1 Tax=Microvirga massiliensis TaxID=1033741 RepID=UPI00062B9210|nr:GYD domain-containing protein [Microvirga massiliensis]